MKFVALCSLSMVVVEGHGYMANPISRGILQSTTPHGIGAVGPGGHINTCGQTDNGFANSIQPPYGAELYKNTNQYQPSRDCISTLKIGSTFRVHVRILAHHIGFQEVRLCSKRISSHSEDTDDCLLLERAAASDVPDIDCSNHNKYGPNDICNPVDAADKHKWYMSPCLDGGALGAGAMGTWCDKFMYFKIPADVAETDEATLQWYWKTGNSCTPGPDAVGTCNYVQAQSQPDWCAAQWPCVNCAAHPGVDAKYFDFSNPSANPTRTACSEIFTTCADVKLSATAAGTTGANVQGSKDAFEGSSSLNARQCDSDLLDVVYSDTADAYTPDSVAPSSGGASSSSGGGGDRTCANGAKCRVEKWSQPCHQWAADAVACLAVGGAWLPDSVAEPEPEPEPVPATTTTTPTTTTAPVPAPVPVPVVAPTPPSVGGCVAHPDNTQRVTDEQCAPCGTGQAWWPCHQSPPLCTCTTGLLHIQATKFSGKVKSKAKVTRHANIDAAGNLRIDP